MASLVDDEETESGEPSRDDLKRIRVGGFSTVIATRAELASQMSKECLAARVGRERPPRLVFSSNGQGIALAAENDTFARAMRAADIIHADGMPVVVASRLLTKSPLPERVSTTDFFHDAAREAVNAGLKFYFLGAKEAQNAAAVAAAEKMYPGLQIVGRRDGYFSAEDIDALCEEIVALRTDVLWVALGKPKQELWSVAHKDKLNGVGWIKTCGGLFSFLSGEVDRAPRWMQRLSLEWMHRMLREPGRLAGRYLMTNTLAAWRLLRLTG